MPNQHYQKAAMGPSGDIVIYDDISHTYTVHGSGRVLKSVTTVIKDLTPVFDMDAVAQKCTGKGKYISMTPDQIKEAWRIEGIRGRTEGNHLHRFAECCMQRFPLPKPESEREASLFRHAAHAVDQLKKKFIFIAAEMIVFSLRLGLAGTIDLLMYDPSAWDIIIIDWKQNKEIKTDNPWRNMLPPIGHLPDCDIIKYGLQLNLYERILMDEDYFNGEFHGIRKAVIHITEDGFYSYPIRDSYENEMRMITPCS